VLSNRDGGAYLLNALCSLAAAYLIWSVDNNRLWRSASNPGCKGIPCDTCSAPWRPGCCL